MIPITHAPTPPNTANYDFIIARCPSALIRRLSTAKAKQNTLDSFAIPPGNRFDSVGVLSCNAINHALTTRVKRGGVTNCR